MIDRGSDHAVRVGQWMTVFRETRGSNSPVFRVGDAQVITVTPESSLAKVQNANDAICMGDRIAVNR